MNSYVMRPLKMLLVAASLAAVAACGGDIETDGPVDQKALADTSPQEKASLAATPITIWPTNAVPRVAAKSDSGSVNAGVKFTTEVSGYVTAIRFYKGSGNSGIHVGSLWSSSGRLLAQATFTEETETGWQTVTFPTPVAITAGTSYTASYLAPRGRYAIDEKYFTQAFVASPLRATAGVFKYGTSSSFPTSEWNLSNYWVDVVFTTASAPAPTPAPSGTAVLTWTAPADPAVKGYRIYYGIATKTYEQTLGSGIDAGASTNYTVTGLAAGTRYHFAVTSVDSTGRESSYSNEATKQIP